MEDILGGGPDESGPPYKGGTPLKETAVMTDEDALLATIREFPEDDVSRLVYADFLEESGDAERAEFIRVQCEMATMESSGEPCEIDPMEGHTCIDDPCLICRSVERYGRLDMRCRELLCKDARAIKWASLPKLRDGSAWWIQFPGDDGEETPSYTFRRGFIDSVSLTLAAYLGGECPDCRGHGRHADHSEAECTSCGGVTGTGKCGTGHTEGVAKRLFEAHPVTRVVLTDREPNHVRTSNGDQSWNWYTGTYLIDPANLPPGVFERMGGTVGEPLDFATRDLALAALSASLVAQGRSLAGLSLLTRSK